MRLRGLSLLLLPFLPIGAAQAQAVQIPAGSIPWSADRPLTVADFRGRPQPTAGHAALTSADINTGANCRGNVFSGSARASFSPARSWVRDPARMTPALLRHEQLHFDMAEVYARRLRQQLAAIHTPCSQLGNTFDQVSQAAYAAWEKAQKDYDRDTNHGLLPELQARWEAQVHQQLAELVAFEAPPGL